MRTVVRRLSYANVMATLAVFVALGGSSYALSEINGRHLKNRSVAGVKLKRNTLTGREIRESRLGRVPDSALLDGLGPASFLRTTDTAADAAKLGGLDPSAFERGAQRFEIEDPTNSTGDEHTVTVGPFTLTPVCAGGNQGARISSSEDHSAMGSVVGPDATASVSADLGSSPMLFIVTNDSTASVRPFELWAVAPSGYRLVVHGWLGRGVLGKSCTVLGGVAVQG